MMTTATVSLEDRLDAISLQLAAIERELAAGRRSREVRSELVETLTPVAEDAYGSASRLLADFEARGYFAFARHAAGVLDRVVGAFDEEDIDQLGDNIVLILETVKEMTQPEVMAMLRRTASAVQLQQHSLEDGEESPPSVRALVGKLRDPEVRRGLSRALDMLRMLAADTELETRNEGVA